ncbi:ribosome hibernation-promoting factor, HPF/YfiA family [Altericroceibacterium endophyticum]|uniref:Ribosome hibernation promoting factor n=1 Tax=Altericroceibacterium endophyticum TaxID=1808508 RepID=A0A6I4T343_9SPHN|nr:ribosome-associated translation inhibitor RaiA [Altericroceibacterium endophyticum]MXO65644.1 ribosome-associated translation inhibitor RaiA [Altericroceibacterium endophyticum]
MDIRVSGHQMETGSALQDHATDRLSAIVEKYFSRAISSSVTFGKAPASAFSCDIVMHVMNGLILKSHGQAQEAHPAFDQAADKIEKQLRRYKRRLKDRHNQMQRAADAENAAYTVFAEEREQDEITSEAPAVVAETQINVPEVSVSDAVMLLDLQHTNALFFKNAGTGRHNMVYRREDSTIGWVEPAK